MLFWINYLLGLFENTEENPVGFFCIHTRHTILILIMWILKRNVLLGLP